MIRMKKVFLNLTLMMFLFGCSFIFFFLHPLFGESDYWVPIDPPKCHYRIDARIDLQKGMVSGKEIIDFKNTSSRAISVLALKNADWLETKIEVSIEGQSLVSLNSKYGDPNRAQIFYRLPKPLLPGEAIKLTVVFQQSFPVTGKETEWKSSTWCPSLWWDSLPTHSSFSVKLDVPQGYALAVSGCLNPVTGRYEIDGARVFGIYLGKDQKIKSLEVDGVQIFVLFTEKGALFAAYCLEEAAKTIVFYKKWLGFYPFEFLYIIPGDPKPIGGYNIATGIVVIHGQETFAPAGPLLHWQRIITHEIGHEYWDEWVLDPENMPSILIGMGQIADVKYMTVNKIDQDCHLKYLQNYLHSIERYSDTTLIMPADSLSKIKYDHNGIVVHSKGYCVISALQAILGQDAFERIYIKCLRLYGAKIMGWKEFQHTCEMESGQNLEWFFNQWIHSNNYLCYQMESQECHSENNGFQSQIRVKQLGTMKMPVLVKVIFEDGSEQVKFTDRNLEISLLEFSSKTKLKTVILNPDPQLAMLKNPLPKISDELAQILALGWDPTNILMIYEKIKDEEIPSWEIWYDLGYDLMEINEFASALQCYQKVLKLPIEENMQAEVNFEILVSLGILSDILEDRSSAVSYYQKALSSDTGGTLEFEILNIKINRNWLEEHLQTPFIWKK
jgi:hypothetical protein